MCPLCHRGFDAQPEVDELVQEVRTELSSFLERNDLIIWRLIYSVQNK